MQEYRIKVHDKQQHQKSKRRQLTIQQIDHGEYTSGNCQ